MSLKLSNCITCTIKPENRTVKDKYSKFKNAVIVIAKSCMIITLFHQSCFNLSKMLSTIGDNGYWFWCTMYTSAFVFVPSCQMYGF